MLLSNLANNFAYKNNTKPFKSKVGLKPLVDKESAHEIINDDFIEKYNLMFSDDKKCVSKKTIILNVNESGMCNRILALYSTIFLAIILDRVLVLNWKPNFRCGIGYEEIFSPNNPRNFIPQPFIYQGNLPKSEHFSNYTSTRCQINLDQSHDFAHFQFIKNEFLLEKIHENCDVIDITSNMNYLKMVLDTKFAKKLSISEKFPYPHYELGKTTFRTHTNFEDKAKKFILKSFAKKPWVSIHARSIHTKLEEFEKVMQLVNSMITDGVVSYVFLATDAYDLNKIAYKNIINKSKLVTIKKKFDKTNYFGHETYSTRDHEGMQDAVLEWIIIGCADYCISTSFYHSTFSKTSIGKSECKFIDYTELPDNRYPKNFGIEQKSVDLIADGNDDNLKELPDINNKEAYKIWESIPKRKTFHARQCYPKGTKLDNVADYWDLGTNNR
jgi:hypothetical protein